MSERNEAITEEALLRHSGWMRALARHLLDSRDRADDVVQETWLAMVRKPLRDGRAMQSWLATVLRNFAFRSRQVERDRRRREQVVSRPETTTMGRP